MPRDENCEKCILHQSSRHVCIWGHGEGEGFVIGEAPGKEEGRTGKPFMGKAGQFGRPVLAEYGLKDPYITNAAKCRPPDNRKPEPDEIKACKPYLLEEIEERKPKAILLWGGIAMRAMIGRTKITEMNGQVVEKDGQTYVCCFHPAYVLRNPAAEVDFRMAVGRYAKLLKDELDTAEPDWKAVDSSTFDEFLGDWADCESFGFDVETVGEEVGDGLAWWKPGFDITSIAFSMFIPSRGEVNWGIALSGHPSAVLDRELCKMLLTEMVRTQGKRRGIAHNGKFDNHALEAVYGVKFRLDSDTMLAHHVVEEESSHSLKPLARRELGAPDFDLTDKEKKNTAAVPIRRLLKYNCSDSAYSRRLEEPFLSRMDRDEKWLYNRVIMPAARAMERAESIGHYIDLDYLNQSSDSEYEKMMATEKELNKLAGGEINWNSPKQVGKVLYHDLGLTPTVFTDRVNPETGNKDTPSTGEDALIDIDHPVAKLLEKYRGHQKFLSTYAGMPDGKGNYSGGWREFMVGNYLYLSTKLHGTVTGRYSSRLHQTPRDGTIRNSHDAPPGWTFCQMDLSQAELRVIAIVSRDPTMLDVFMRGKDIHWFTLMDAIATGGGEYVATVEKTARLLTKRKMDFPDKIELLREAGHEACIDLVKDWKEGRKKAKGINFGFAYGQSAEGFINYAKLKYGFEPSLEESTNFRNSYFGRYIMLPAWHERQKRLVRADGFVRNMSGRKRHLPGIYSSDRSLVAEAERQAINSPIQGFIGDYKAMILVEVDETFSPDQLLIKGEVHDSILMWIKNEHLDTVLPRLHHLAEHPKLAKECGLEFPIPMTVDIELGRWGAGKRWSPQCP